MYPFWQYDERLPTQRLQTHYLFECGAVVTRMASWSESTPGRGTNLWTRYWFDTLTNSPVGEVLFDTDLGEDRVTEKPLPTSVELTVAATDKTPLFLACDQHWQYCRKCNPDKHPLDWTEPT